MTHRITVEPFEEAFLPSLRALYLSSRKASFAWLNTSHYCLSDFDTDVEGELIWVAMAGEKIVGFISIWEPENFIHHLYVAPDCLRQGIGHRLLEFAKHRYSTLSLKCMVQNESALRFYRQQGFISHSKGQDVLGEYYLLESKG